MSAPIAEDMPVSESIARITFIAAGGAIGSVLRYVLGGVVQQSVVLFPIGTLAVNVAGCLAIGVLAELFTESSLDPLYRTAVLVGVLGGFTTFSTFSLDTLKLAENRQYGLAAMNVALSLCACLAATFVGQRLGKWWTL